MKKNTQKLLPSLLIPLILLFIPLSWIPIPNITIVEQRMLAIFFLAILFWVFEPIPIFATSVVIITAELLLISTKGPIWLRDTATLPHFGTLIDYTAILHTFASPIIMLFLGGFFLAMGATKYRLDINLARVFLKPFGTKPSLVMLGLMLITALFSMFMSNTATTALMFAILTPILKLFNEDDPGRVAFVLSIPFAANIGGIGTPIGTPPNAVSMKYLTGSNVISFSEWMSFATPFALILLFLTWQLLLFLFPPKEKEISLKIKSKFLTNWQAIVVYITFATTIILWLTSKVHGMSSYVVAMIPVTIFVATNIITKQELKKINWDVLWLISGGIALGLGLEKTGLSLNIVNSVSLETFSPFVIILLFTLAALIMSTFISNTATANLILPLVAVLGSTVTSLGSLGGDKMLILLVTFSCSLAMALPISTPPNALAYATDYVDTKSMLKSGVIVGLVGLIVTWLMGYVLNMLGFFPK